jgi:hypothetical protein
MATKPQQFDWAKKELWPYGGAEYFFAAEALCLFGTSLYGGEWSGRELRDAYRSRYAPDGLPTLLPDSVSIRRAGIALLRERGGPELSVQELTDDQWSLVLSAESDFLKDRPVVRERLAAAERAMQDACARGVAVSATKGVNGDFWEIKPERWNRDDALTWLRDGIIIEYDAHPNSHGGAGNQRYYLFFRKDSVAAATGTTAKSAPAFEGYLSPYMMLMLDVIAACGITADDQSKVENVILPYIESEWKKRGFPDSNNLRKAMATMVRHPDAQAGRAKKVTG